MGSPKRSLADYAEANPPGRRASCWTCTIPERAEVDAGFRAGLMPTAIHRWLTDPEEGPGYDPQVISTARLDYHKRQGHHVAS